MSPTNAKRASLVVSWEAIGNLFQNGGPHSLLRDFASTPWSVGRQPSRCSMNRLHLSQGYTRHLGVRKVRCFPITTSSLNDSLGTEHGKCWCDDGSGIATRGQRSSHQTRHKFSCPVPRRDRCNFGKMTSENDWRRCRWKRWRAKNIPWETGRWSTQRQRSRSQVELHEGSEQENALEQHGWKRHTNNRKFNAKHEEGEIIRGAKKVPTGEH